MVANLETQPQQMLVEFKEIDDNGYIMYVSQRRPWAQRQGMPQDLQNFENLNNQWKNPNFSNPNHWNPSWPPQN